MARFATLGLGVKRAVEGPLLATLPGGAGGNGGRMLSHDVDTPGAMVEEVKPNGRLTLTQIRSEEGATIEGE